MKDKATEDNAIINRLQHTWRGLANRILINLFILEHPELEIDFPVQKGIMISYPADIVYPEQSETTIKIKDNLYEVESESCKLSKDKQQKKADSLIRLKNRAKELLKSGDWYDDVDEINIREKESFKVIYEYCAVMTYLCYERPSKNNAEAFVYLSIILMQKYFELMGYWTRKMEEKSSKRDSGKGQKNAKENRVQKISEAIKEFVNERADELHIDKGLFNKILCNAFEGAEDYPRHHKTITTYKEEVEHKLGKKIIWKNKRK